MNIRSANNGNFIKNNFFSYNLYKETEQLIELQLIFNKMLGVPVNEDTNYNMLTLKANKVNNDPMKPNSDQMHSDVQVFDISATK